MDSGVDKIFNLQRQNAKAIQQTSYKERIKKINLILEFKQMRDLKLP